MMGKETKIPDRLMKTEYFRNLDAETASGEEIVACLAHVIEDETGKPDGESDSELIWLCSEWMEKLTPDANKLSPEESEANFKRLQSEMGKPDAGKATTVPSRKSKKRGTLRVVAVIAAVLVLLFATLSVAASVNGYGNAFEFVSSKVSELLNMKPGDSKDSDGITITRNGDSKIHIAQATRNPSNTPTPGKNAKVPSPASMKSTPSSTARKTTR